MKHFKILFVLVLLYFVPSLNAQDDTTPGSTVQYNMPAHIKALSQQIKLAEDNGDMATYSSLRKQIIEAWQKVNPQIAKLYRNVNSGVPDYSADGNRLRNNAPPNDMIETETEAETPTGSVLWGNDKLVHDGSAYDISMDVDKNGDIYLAVIGRLNSSTTKDSVYIYKSTNGGVNWTRWSFIFSSTQSFEQIELMCFDGTAAADTSYILLFFRFNDGMFRVGRRLTGTGSWSYYTIVSLNVTDFAVDRNYSSLYRAICVYDSSNYIKCVRSEPNSKGTIWQDKSPVGQSQLSGKDLDFTYGWNGAVYATYNGFGSGNLYVDENTNYGDPASWNPRYTVVQGSVDTTRHAEIIASRQDDPNNQVAVVYELQSGTNYDLYIARRDSGTWISPAGWVNADENKWPTLYCRKATNNTTFRSVFLQSGAGNAPPRIIKYKSFENEVWSTSIQVSDNAYDPTGLQKPQVADLNGTTPIFAYVGANYLKVYFDNSSWVTSVNPELVLPETYVLSQNYPNPFNPSTLIRYQIPSQSFVSIKVYDAIGNLIKELVNEDKSAGSYELEFNAAKLASGVYFYRIQAGSFVQTKKMILVR